jgi:hypothetical protein
MKKNKTAAKTAKRTSLKSVSKKLAKKSFFQDVFRFRWLKKAMVGKTPDESLDLLDHWILKKKSLTLFF